MENKAVFRVVRGIDEKIKLIPYEDGKVYFATDTKKIYLDANEQRTPMGGNTGIYYGDANFANMEDTEFYFEFNEIEGDVLPTINDLILNTDGSFYKVVGYINELIQTEKLTIAGSGGDNNTGSLAKLSMDIVSYPKAVIAGYKCEIKFNFIALNSLGEQTGNGRYTVAINNVIKASGVAYLNEENSIDIGEFLTVPDEYTITVVCYGYKDDATEYSTRRQIKINSTNFLLNWEYEDTKINYTDTDLVLEWNLSDTINDIVTNIIIDDSISYTAYGSNPTLTISAEELKSQGIKQGAHTVKMTATGSYEGITGLKANDGIPVIHNLLFYDRNSTGYIITCNFFGKKINQYDTIQLPVMIYSAANTDGKAVIDFSVDGKPYPSKQNCANLIEYRFAYTPETFGYQQLNFTCGGAHCDLILDVAKVDLDVSEVPGYDFKFSASSFVNNEAVLNWECNGLKIIFSENFDWINGGLLTGEGDVGPYFKIRAGTTMTIPYQLFKYDLKETGACFKIIFKVLNCRDTDAEWLRSYEELIIDEKTDNSRGIILKAQNGILKTLNTKSVVYYCEEEYIAYEFDFSKYSSNRADRYMINWIDGVLSSAVLFSESDTSRQNNPTNLVIGSEDCDVHVYLMRFYQKHLTNYEHLDNFIIDAYNSTEMIARYNRNNILTQDRMGNKYISPYLLAEKNNKCNVYMYEVPYVPTTKDDVIDKDGKTECCTFTHLYGSREAVRHYEGVKLRAQGTSSMTYGVAAFNLDAKFPEKWSMDDEAIPVNYMNTKVNVASSEGANNALNQEWYNRFLPYKTLKRIADSKARDTMEFKPGVIFLTDNNLTFNAYTGTDEEKLAANKNNNVFGEINGYLANPYPRLYSVCNMGNSKKNTEVFHGAGNEYECCVEVKDNNTSTEQMIFVGGYDVNNNKEIALNLPDSMFDENGFVIKDALWGADETESVTNKGYWYNSINGEYFEFRYHNENTDENELGDRFLRLVHWFAKNNPVNYPTEEEIKEAIKNNELDKYEQYKLDEPITFETYTFKGVKKSTGYNYDIEDEILNSNVKVSTNITYTYDTREYRAEKMLRECEDYLIMDSVVYHYLFIERHTMSDNVAKNTFWNTEDGIHWELTKNYDNDTADGVNNNGLQVFDYGYEIYDKHKTGKDSVFNAISSAWLNFIYYLPDVVKEVVYKNRAAKGAWQALSYLTLFKEEWQDLIPEICWINSFDRVYFRPYNIYNDSSYIGRLNGKKTYQREQYEKYLETYIDSKYKYLPVNSTNYILWRTTTTDDALHEDGTYSLSCEVELYADGYLSLAIVNGTDINFHKRGKKGDKLTFRHEQESNYTDGTGYLFYPTLILSMENVLNLYPNNINLTYGNHLRNFSYIPENEGQKVCLNGKSESSDISFNMGNNLEQIIIKDCINAAFGLDLSGCSKLKKIDTSGSAFTAYDFANGAPLTSCIMEAPSSLSMSNLYYLTLENFLINTYAGLRLIRIDNIDTNVNGKQYKSLTKKIIFNILNSLNPNEKIDYSLKNVKWIIDENDGITSEGIELLDNLLLKGLSIGINTKIADSLTGNAKIPLDIYNESSITVYEKYGLVSPIDNSYPNLILDFEGNNSKLYTVTIVNGNGIVKWQRLYEIFDNISNADLVNSALGAIDKTTMLDKSPSVYEIYTFNDRWKYTTESGKTDEIKGDSIGEYYYLDLSKLQKIEEENIIIEPDYKIGTHYYTVKFLMSEDSEPFYVSSGHIYQTHFSNIAPKFLPYKDDSDLAFSKTYKLLGYSLSADGTSLIVENSWYVTQDCTLYPVYSEASIYNVDYSNYLDIDDNNVLRGIKYDEVSGQEAYKGSKIVIPTNVKEIGEYAFSENSTLKYIFVAENNNLSEIKSYSFNNPLNPIKYFDFANCTKLTAIGNEAFRGAALNPNLYPANTIFLSSKLLTAIGNGAFNSCMDKGTVNENGELVLSPAVTIKVSASVSSLGAYAFAHWDNSLASTIELGSPNDPSSFLAPTNATVVINANYKDGIRDITTVEVYSRIYLSKEELEQYITPIGLSVIHVD